MPLINNVNELNERIGIYEVQASSGPDPGEDEPELIFECWAKIRTQTITDIEKNYATDFKDVIQIVIRQIQDHKITNKMKVMYAGQLYDIFKINPDLAYKDYMVLFVKTMN